MKKSILLFFLLSFLTKGFCEEDPKPANEQNSADVSESTQNTTNNINNKTYSYQDFKYDFVNYNMDEEYDVFKKKRRRKKKRRSGTIDESLIYFGAGTGVLILTPTILSAADKDVKVGGALAADFVLAGILTYAFLKETR